jgi:hypothetical protein
MFWRASEPTLTRPRGPSPTCGNRVMRRADLGHLRPEPHVWGVSSRLRSRQIGWRGVGQSARWCCSTQFSVELQVARQRDQDRGRDHACLRIPRRCTGTTTHMRSDQASSAAGTWGTARRVARLQFGQRARDHRVPQARAAWPRHERGEHGLRASEQAVQHAEDLQDAELVRRLESAGQNSNLGPLAPEAKSGGLRCARTRQETHQRCGIWGIGSRAVTHRLRDLVVPKVFPNGARRGPLRRPARRV